MSRQTPEGIVKDAVKAYLNSIGCVPASKAPLATPAHHGYYFMPPANGMGVSGIPDFVGHYKGRFFSVETKVEGKDPTPLQKHQIMAIRMSGAQAFVVRGADNLEELKAWVKLVNLAERSADR